MSHIMRPSQKEFFKEQLSAWKRGRQRKPWTGNSKEWSGCSISTLTNVAEERVAKDCNYGCLHYDTNMTNNLNYEIR